jgi:type IV secretory pathway TrbD component
MKLTSKLRRDWHYYAFAIGLIFILNGVVGLLGFDAKGWQTYAVGLVTWVISFWLAGLIIRRRPEEATAETTDTANKVD